MLKLKYYRTKDSNRAKKIKLRRSKCSVHNVYEIIMDESNKHMKLSLFDKNQRKILCGSSSIKLFKELKKKDTSLKKMDLSKMVGIDMRKKCDDLNIDSSSVFINIGEKKYIGNAKVCIDGFYSAV